MNTGIANATICSDEVLTRPMPTRPLGQTGWNASRLTMGGVKWDTQGTDAEAVAILHRAMELGVNTFDTAHLYGAGESERRLGIAMQGRREEFWINTKSMDRTYDGAMQQMEMSLKRLKVDYVDLMFVHGVDHQEDCDQILEQHSVLEAMQELKAAGKIRHIGVSGHWVRQIQCHLLREFPFEAVLFPIGLFNEAHNYSFLTTTLPTAKSLGIATLGMKVFGVGRVKHTADVEPYLRFGMQADVDSMVIGCDSIAQLEQTVGMIKSYPPPLTADEVRSFYPEALRVTQEWDAGEFDWVSGYK
ncbi:MAG: aldo/keto reductase [Chthonomonadales bacterium]